MPHGRFPCGHAHLYGFATTVRKEMREMDRQTRQIPVNVSGERFLSPHIRSPNETDTFNGNVNFKLDDSMFLDELPFQSRITICMNVKYYTVLSMIL